jgi:ribosomal protein S18 acetylase RimI-like enzyme
MIYAPINRKHESFIRAHSGIVKHTNKNVKRETWAHYFSKTKNGSISTKSPSNIAQEIMWVCYNGARVVGASFVGIDDNGNAVHPMLVVHGDYRCKGIATSLMKLLVATFSTNHKGDFIVKAGSKTRMFRILTKIGFKQIGADKIPITNLNNEPIDFKEIAILKI